MIGRASELAPDVQRELARRKRRPPTNTGMLFNIALNYGGRAEIVDAARRLLEAGVAPDELDEQRFADFLYTAGQPDPDLLIRTSGEMRVSNFLLWQIAYAEIWVTDTLWPDFRKRHLLEAILAYQKRDRRYGGITSRRSPADDPADRAKIDGDARPQRGRPAADRHRHCLATFRRWPRSILASIAASLAFVEYARPGGGARRCACRARSPGPRCWPPARPVGFRLPTPTELVLMTAFDHHRRAGGRVRRSPGRACWPTRPRRCSRCSTSACRSARWRPSARGRARRRRRC